MGRKLCNVSLAAEEPVLREQAQALVLFLGRLYVAPGSGYSLACLHPCRDRPPLRQMWFLFFGKLR